MQGQRVLLIMPAYFGYQQEIMAALRQKGAEVEFVADRPFQSPAMKAITRVNARLIARQADRYFMNEVERLGKAFDQVLVINGEAVTLSMLRMLRSACPQARLTYYAWDSLANKPFTGKCLDTYDRCFSFDPLDAKQYGMGLRPLFFTPGFVRQIPSAFTYDISFVGTIHSDRYRILSSLKRQVPVDASVLFYMYLQAPWMYGLRKVFTRTVVGARAAEFKFVSLRPTEVQDIFFKSKAVVDVEHPGQRGLTMRTIEALGSQTKLITTNPQVADYDFYDPANVCIVDRAKPALPSGFLEKPYAPVDEAVYQRYSLSAWLGEVAGG